MGLPFSPCPLSLKISRYIPSPAGSPEPDLLLRLVKTGVCRRSRAARQLVPLCEHEVSIDCQDVAEEVRLQDLPGAQTFEKQGGNLHLRIAGLTPRSRRCAPNNRPDHPKPQADEVELGSQLPSLLFQLVTSIAELMMMTATPMMMMMMMMVMTMAMKMTMMMAAVVRMRMSMR